eukprot:TRINITY_DN2010_c3_g2_i1.p1 TRINITY_DN2010_c3_g2~~TRINITY_DN2010_c3_g2_i1.p1  ORF type:complete len:397 (+),score=152.94 TRINITY_DN2010_c3_g2_i1:52-1191(+)
MGKEVWLGVALPDYVASDEEETPYFSKVGGLPTWLNAPHRVACSVPGCGREAQLVAQLHAPLEQAYRILYVFACREEGCIGKTEAWKVLRGQCLDTETTPAPTAAAAPQGESRVDAFKTDDNWGDSDDDNGFGGGGFGDDNEGSDNPFGKQAEVDTSAQLAELAASTPAGGSSVVDTTLRQNQLYTSEPPELFYEKHARSTPYSMVPLDIVEEPEEDSSEVNRYRAQYAGVSQANAAAVGVSTEGAGSAPEGYEKSGSSALRSFVKFGKRLQREPMQVVRWCFGGKPLNPSGVAHPVPPPCGNCGCPRVPEAQVLSTVLSFIHREDVADLAQLANAGADTAFAAATIFSCSRTCNPGDAYVTEVVHVEKEPVFGAGSAL